MIFTDTLGNKLRTLSSTQIVTTLIGSGIVGSSDGVALLAMINNPAGVAVDSDGNIYFSDTLGNKLRALMSGSSVTTPLITTGLIQPRGISFASNNIVFCDSGNNLVKLYASGTVSAIAGGGSKFPS